MFVGRIFEGPQWSVGALIGFLFVDEEFRKRDIILRSRSFPESCVTSFSFHPYLYVGFTGYRMMD